MPGATEQPNRAPTTRRRSANLSAVAAVVTTIVLGIGIATGPASDTAWLIFIIVFAFPPIALSVVAAARYRRPPPSGTRVEKAAVVVYWVFVVVFWLEGGVVLIPGALLQTAAWYVSRRSS